MKWLLLLIAAAALAWWLERLARSGAVGSSLPAVNGVPADAVFVKSETVAGVTAQVYESPAGVYVTLPINGISRTFGPLSNLDVTRLLQLQQALGGGA